MSGKKGDLREITHRKGTQIKTISFPKATNNLTWINIDICKQKKEDHYSVTGKKPYHKY